jgi:ribose 5-phosphate isomerase B
MFKNKNILIGSDHAGFLLKEDIKKYLESNNYKVLDCGTDSAENSVDYPDFSKKLCNSIKAKKAKKGILICGTGIGMSISANRYSFIRAALCNSVETAKLSREHNDANVLVLGARVLDKKIVKKMVDTFLETKFLKGRHKKRIEKI